MTTDPEGAKRFYDAVVGWDIGPAHDEIGYRMIGRSDGGIAGGVLPLNDEMPSHGARPIWMGYIGVDDVDATVAQIEAKGGRTHDAAARHRHGRPHRDGRRPAGQSLLRDEADPAGGRSRTRTATSSRRPRSNVSAGTS